MKAPAGDGEAGWPPYRWLEKNGPNTSILNNFWGAKINRHDIELHNRFLEILKLHSQGHNPTEIARKLSMSGNVHKYLSGEKKHVLTYLLWQLEKLGIPYKIYRQPPIWRLEVEPEEAAKLPIFNPRINSHNYQHMRIMANAKTLLSRRPIPD